MNMMLRTGLLALAMLLLAGCGPQQRAEDPEYAALKAQHEAQPNDTIALGRLADAAQARFRATKQLYYREEAITYYGRYLEASPNHVGGSVALYALLGSRYLDSSYPPDLTRMRELFAQVGLLRESSTIAPPSLVEALVFLNRRGRIDEIAKPMRKALVAAIRENPRNTTSHLLLADLYYATDRVALAEAMITQAYEAQPEHPPVLRARAIMLYDRAQDSMCVDDREAHRVDVKSAIAAIKAAAKASPKEADLARRLSVMYESFDRRQLALFQAKHYDDLAGDEDSRWFLVDQYVAAAQFAEAERQAKYAAGRDGRDAGAIEQMAMLAYQKGDLEAALPLFREYRLLARQPSVYLLIREANLAWRLGKPQQAQKALDAGDPNEGVWEGELLAFHKGNINSQELLSRAADACNRAEAHYYIAHKAWRDGDAETARKHFQLTRDQWVPRYYEHTSAKFRLTEL